ncbi:hypothetical protein V8F33_001391 [Rhypophila sp. PSN 637]
MLRADRWFRQGLLCCTCFLLPARVGSAWSRLGLVSRSPHSTICEQKMVISEEIRRFGLAWNNIIISHISASYGQARVAFVHILCDSPITLGNEHHGNWNKKKHKKPSKRD